MNLIRRIKRIMNLIRCEAHVRPCHCKAASLQWPCSVLESAHLTQSDAFTRKEPQNGAHFSRIRPGKELQKGACSAAG